MIESKFILSMIIFMALGTACQEYQSVEIMTEQPNEPYRLQMIRQSELALSDSSQRDQHIIKPYPALSVDAEQFIGRYQVTISCQDPYAGCKDGVVEATVLLLEDGTAHRSVINIGSNQVTHDVRQRRDFWTYDQQYRQVIIQNTEGAEIFFNIINGRDLIMDLERIANATEHNRQYFSHYGSPFPQEAYVLERVL